MEFLQVFASLILLSLGFPMGYYTLKKVPEEKVGLPYFHALALLLFVGAIITTIYQDFSLWLLAGSLLFLWLYVRNHSALVAAVYFGLTFAPAPNIAAFILAFAYGLCSGAEDFSLGLPFRAWPALALLAIGTAARLLA